MAKISILVPVGKTVESPFLMSLFSVFTEVAKEHTANMGFSDEFGICKARTGLMVNAIKNDDSDYLLWIDSDVIIPTGAFTQMMKHDKDIVSAMYFNRGSKCRVVARDFQDDGCYHGKILGEGDFNKLLPTDGVGFGCVLIKRKVVDALMKKHGSELFKFSTIKSKKTGEEFELSEDLFFCKLAREMGFEIWLDTGISCGHLGGMVTEGNYLYGIWYESHMANKKISEAEQLIKWRNLDKQKFKVDKNK